MAQKYVTGSWEVPTDPPPSLILVHLELIRTGLGSNTRKVLTMGRTHTGITHYYTWEIDHPVPPQPGMDHREWNLERCKSEMGTDIGNTTENLRLVCNPTTTRDNPHFFPYQTYPPDDHVDLTGERVPTGPQFQTCRRIGNPPPVVITSLKG